MITLVTGGSRVRTIGACCNKIKRGGGVTQKYSKFPCMSIKREVHASIFLLDPPIISVTKMH